MRNKQRWRPLCGHISNAKPLNDGDKCIRNSTMRFGYQGGWLYFCDYHSGCFGVTFVEKQVELILRVYQTEITLMTIRMLREMRKRNGQDGV